MKIDNVKGIINNNTIPTSDCSKKERNISIFVTLPIQRSVVWQRNRFFCWCVFCSFLLLIADIVMASSNQQQQRRSSSTSSSFSNNNNNRQPKKYDRSVTTFDPHGQLLQIQYAQYAATQRTRRTIIAMIDRIHNNIYIATTTLLSTTNTYDDELPQQQQQPHQFVYPITKHVYFIGIGLIGDIRTMASHVRVQVQQYIYQYQENMTILQIANIICQLQHQCTYQSGIRPLGVTCLIFGIDDDSINDHTNIDGDGQTNATPWKLYKCTPGGSIPEDCGSTTTTHGDSDDFSCTVMGYQEETILKLIYNYEDLQSGNLNLTDNDEDETNGSITISDTATNIMTSPNMDEADCILHFISAIQSAFSMMDGANHNNIGNDSGSLQLTDVYVFRSRSHHRQQRPVASCFANIDCGSNNNAFQSSLKRVRQYYNKQ